MPAGGVELPATRCGDLFFVDVLLDGAGPLHLLLDTGAEVSVLDVETDRALAGDGRRAGTNATGSGGQAQVIESWRRADVVAVGGFELRDVDLAVMDLGGLRAAVGGRFDGILGYSAFQGVLLELDYPGDRVRVAPGELPDVDGAEVLGLASRLRPYVSLRRADGSYLQALIDTGATGALSLPDLDGFELRAPPVLLGRSHGVGGSTPVEAARLRGTLRLGRHELRDPVIASSRKGGRLGGAALRDFVVTLDARGRKVSLRRALEGPVLFEEVRGLSVVLDLDGDGWRVSEVYGEAADGPLAVGDRIEAVDGVAVSELGCARFGLFREAAAVVLRVRRDGALQDVLAPVRILVR